MKFLGLWVGGALFLLLAGCAALFSGTSDARQSVLLACSPGITAAVETLTDYRHTGLLDDEISGAVDDALMVVTPICTAEEPSADALAVLNETVSGLRLLLLRHATAFENKLAAQGVPLDEFYADPAEFAPNTQMVEMQEGLNVPIATVISIIEALRYAAEVIQGIRASGEYDPAAWLAAVARFDLAASGWHAAGR